MIQKKSEYNMDQIKSEVNLKIIKLWQERSKNIKIDMIKKKSEYNMDQIKSEDNLNQGGSEDNLNQK